MKLEAANENSITKIVQSKPMECFMLPDGFLPRYEMVEKSAKLGIPNAINILKGVSDYLMEQDLLGATFLLRCHEDNINQNPEIYFALVAKARFRMCSVAVKSQVVMACKMKDFDAARKTLRVNKLFKDPETLGFTI